MKTAQPASLPPGVSGSGGINRSTMASTAAPSSGVKNSHGPGRTNGGGTPASGFHGKPPAMVRARPEAVDKRSDSAVAASSSRRRTPIPFLLDLPSVADDAFVSAVFLFR